VVEGVVEGGGSSAVTMGARWRGGRRLRRWGRGGVLRISLLRWTGQYEALANKAVSKRSGQPRNAKREGRAC
jgi:hypothetical protein